MKCLLILVVILASHGCNKKDAAPPKSTQDLLINKKWKVVSVSRLYPDGVTVEPDYYSVLPVYEKDDYYFFRWISTYEINDNDLRRPSSEDQIYDEGTWSLSQGDKYLELQSSRGIGYVPIEITNISEVELRFRRDQVDGRFDFVLKPIP